jgi:hypothetical protein
LHPNIKLSASNKTIQHFSLESRDMKKLIIALLITLAGTGSAIAKDSELKLPIINKSLQSQIDKKIELSLKKKTLQFSKTNYLAQKQLKTNKAS